MFRRKINRKYVTLQFIYDKQLPNRKLTSTRGKVLYFCGYEPYGNAVFSAYKNAGLSVPESEIKEVHNETNLTLQRAGSMNMFTSFDSDIVSQGYVPINWILDSED